MQQTKYDELKKENEVLAKKIAGQHRLAQSSLVLLKNIDARIEAIKDLSVEAGLYTEDQYQDKVDEKLGLRKKADNETIELADVVWVSYTAEVEGVSEKQKEENLPVRVGSGAVMFESALLGKKCNDKGIVFDGVWKENNPSEPLKPIEHKVKFTIDIQRVKARRKDDNGNGISDDIDRADGVGGENSDIAMFESDPESQGSGQPVGINSETQYLE